MNNSVVLYICREKVFFTKILKKLKLDRGGISVVLLYYISSTIAERGERMAWNMEPDRPIYAQLIEKIQTRIVSGYYGCGERLPSVRELAADAAVNPNTMQKAFAELERSGLIVTQRTNGRIVTEDKELIDSVRCRLAQNHIDAFGRKMKELGFTKEQIFDLMDRRI